MQIYAYEISRMLALPHGAALIAPIDTRHPVSGSPNSWLEFHASMSLVAYGVFALACASFSALSAETRSLARFTRSASVSDELMYRL